MDLVGRSVMVAGTFAALGPGEARHRLEAAGVAVTEAAVPSTAAAFIGDVPGNEVGATYVQGVPVFDEAALLGTLARLESRAAAAAAPAGGFAADLGRLAGADWAAFDPARDLVALRERLDELERAHGVTAAHRIATERILARGTRLSRPFAERTEVTALALSADGRHLATGGWGAGWSGTLQIWDVAAGRSVNVVRGIEGGIGWQGFAGAIQWSADGEHIGMAFRTNAVGVWDPFGESAEPRAEAQVTNGASRPPEWALHPGGRRAFVSVRGDGAHGCVVPLECGKLFWLPDALESPNEFALAGPLPPAIEHGTAELPIDSAGWSPDGARLHCFGRGGAFAVDAATGAPLWHAFTGDAAWSPDGRLVAHVRRGKVLFIDGETGGPYGGPAPVTAGRQGASLHWTAGARLAVVTAAGVDVFDDGHHRHHLPVDPAEAPEGDFESWAWAPSGERGAVLTAGGEIEIWAVDAPRPQRAVPAPEGTAGVLWGAGDVIVAAGPSTLRFVAAGTGETISDHTRPVEPGVRASRA